VVSPVEPDEQPRALVRWGDELALAGKSWGASTSSMQVVRFSSAGTLRDVHAFDVGIASSGLKDAVVDGEGRLVVAGYAFADGENGLQTNAAVARLTGDGALDSSFGEAGVVLIDVAGHDDEVFSLLALADGGLIAAGRTSLPVDNGVVPTRGALWHLSADGAVLHQATVTLAGESDELVAVSAHQGGFVAVGTAVYEAGNRASVAVVRVDDQLALDPSFGDGGVGLYDPGAFLASVGVSVHSVGARLLVGATIDNGAAMPDFDLALLALDEHGNLDTSYGTQGVVAASVHTLRGLPEPSPDLLRAVVPDGAGGAVLVGDSEGRPVLVRVDNDGALDQRFGNAGLERVDPCGPSGLVADAELVDGRLVVAGACYRDPFFADAVLVRFTLDGAGSEGEGEGEGEGAEGEGEGAEGEGEGAEGEGEGTLTAAEGERERSSCTCRGSDVGPHTVATASLLALVALRLRRRRYARHRERRPAPTAR